MVNNTANDGTLYFLTADHCLGGNIANWVFRFNWEAPHVHECESDQYANRFRSGTARK